MKTPFYNHKLYKSSYNIWSSLFYNAVGVVNIPHMRNNLKYKDISYYYTLLFSINKMYIYNTLSHLCVQDNCLLHINIIDIYLYSIYYINCIYTGPKSNTIQYAFMPSLLKRVSTNRIYCAIINNPSVFIVDNFHNAKYVYLIFLDFV